MSEQPISPEAYAGLLRAEVEHYDRLFRDLQKRTEEMRLYAFSAAGALAAYFSKNPNNIILLLLPIGVFAAYFNGLHSVGEMRAIAAHKTHLERKLRLVLRRHLPEQDEGPPGSWEQGGGYVRVRSLSVKTLEGFYTTAMVAIPTISLTAAWKNLGSLWWLSLVVAAVCLASAALAGLVWRTILHTYDDTLACLDAQSTHL